MKPLLLAFQMLVATAMALRQDAWTNRYNGPGNSTDGATGISVDPSGDVFVTGYSVGSSIDYATLAYSSLGVPLWTNRFDGGGTDNATAIAIGQNGSVFLTGASYNFNTYYYDCATIAYSGSGLPLWTNRYVGDRWVSARAIAVGDNGDVFVTGEEGGSNARTYGSTIAYSSAGVELWQIIYDEPAAHNDQLTDIAVGSSGNIYVTGDSAGTSSGGNYATIAYSNVGVPLWTNLYNGPANYDDFAVAIATGGNGDVFVAGYSFKNGSADYATIAYSSAGMPLWTNFYNGPANGDDRPTGLAVDSGGNVLVTGTSGGSGSGQDYATIAYSSAGVPLWTNRYNGPGNTYDSATAIAVDSNGNVFVTGYSTISDTHSEIVTIAYSNAGVPLRTNYYGGFGSGTNQAKAIAVDNAGNAYVTGTSIGPGSGLDYVTIKYPEVNAATPILLLRPEIAGGEFVFSLQTDANRSYTVQVCTNLTTAPWKFVTNVLGDGTEKQVRVATGSNLEAYYRVSSD